MAMRFYEHLQHPERLAADVKNLAHEALQRIEEMEKEGRA